MRRVDWPFALTLGGYAALAAYGWMHLLAGWSV